MSLVSAQSPQRIQYPYPVKFFELTIVVKLAGVGHIPHVQEPERFKTALLDFLKSNK